MPTDRETEGKETMKPEQKPKQKPPVNHPWRAFNYRAKRNTTALPNRRFRMLPQ